MASLIKFTSTKLNNSGKQGILVPDDNGYFTVTLGGLNTFNSAGEYYVAEGAKQLFESNSILMRRIKNGCLYGENGHPKRQPGMSMDQYISRIYSIEETNYSFHISEVWLDTNFGKDNPQFKNPQLIGIMGKIRPTGPMAASLTEGLQNGRENICFSIRALTDDYIVKGVNHRVLKQIITWDRVTEPGISHANKWDCPSLESLTEINFTERSLNNILNSKNNIATEDSIEQIKFTLEHLKDRKIVKSNKPLITKW